MKKKCYLCGAFLQEKVFRQFKYLCLLFLISCTALCWNSQDNAHSAEKTAYAVELCAEQSELSDVGASFDGLSTAALSLPVCLTAETSGNNSCHSKSRLLYVLGRLNHEKAFSEHTNPFCKILRMPFQHKSIEYYVYTLRRILI